ncbi:hypothetical protein cypCar_00039337 [Cyprinus carpio]|nr:hypothetical protein cypCar_00039337 [Cyprinus carpio]
MADMCHLFLLGLAILSSLLAGTSGVDDAHVFITSGENVCLPCNNALHDCTSTTWIYNKDSTAVELIDGGKKKKDTERHERLNLGSDCSLNINNISTEDYGFYTCRQWTGVNRDKHQEPDARVYLHVLHVSQTEISAGLSVTLSCQLYSYAGVSCDDSFAVWYCLCRSRVLHVIPRYMAIKLLGSDLLVSSFLAPCSWAVAASERILDCAKK